MKKKQNRNPSPNKQMLAFVAAFEGDPTGAATIAGYKDPVQAGASLMMKPHVRRLVDAKIAKVVEVSAKKLAKTIAKCDITERLLKLADIDPEDTNNNITGQVNALKALAEIEGFVVKKTEDVTKLAEGRTDEEKEFFAVNGYWPEREPNVYEGEPGALGSKNPDAGGSKPN